MIELIDQTGRKVTMASLPNRIISTVPSQTELLFHLGLGSSVLGRTRFCIHPKQEVKSITDIGGTKSLKLEKIQVLKPDLIIANKEENDKEQIEELAQYFPLYLSDITDIPSSYKMIEDVAQLIGAQTKGEELVSSLKIGFSKLPKYTGSVAYLIWYNPIMISAKGTFIHKVLEFLGFKNTFAHKERYPEVSLGTLAAQKPNYIFLSSEPYPFKEKHLEEIQKHCPNSKVILVDGEMFSWYGSRMLNAIEYFKNLRNQL